MHLLSRLALRNRALIVLVCLFVCVFGVISVGQLKQELIPSVELPQITVSATDQGASPEVMDKQVGQPLESSIQAVEGLDSSTSTSTTGSTRLDLTFEYGTDLDRARNQVDRAISNVSSQLPDGVEPSSFAGSIADLPIVYYAVAGKGSLAETADAMNTDVVPALTKLDGVRQVSVSGASSQFVRIAPDTKKLAAAGLTPADLQKAVQEAGGAMSLGKLDDGDLTLPIQTSGALSSTRDIESLPVSAAKGTTTIGDVAAVSVRDEETTSITRTDGERTLALAVTKKPDADTVRVSDAVKDAVPDLSAKTGSTFTMVFDQAPSITDSIHDLTVEGVLGLVFAVLVILLFLLSVRSTLVTAVSIPLSLLVTFIGIWAFGFSLNMLTLGALTISIGRVVDDAIVVIENIKRHLSYGEDRVTAILGAVREVAGAVTASTLTTVAVFLPVAFVGGLAGELFRPFALTVTISLIASLLVALTIVPVLAYWFLRGADRRKPGAAAVPDGAGSGPADSSPEAVRTAAVPAPAATAGGAPSVAAEPGASGEPGARGEHAASGSAVSTAQAAERRTWLQRAYSPALRGTQHHPVITLVAAVLILIATFAATPLLKTNLLGSMGETSFSSTLQMPAGTSLERTDEASQKIEKVLRDVDGVKDVQSTIGSSGDALSALSGGGGSSQAAMTVTVEDGADTEAVLTAAKDATADVKTGGELEYTASSGGGFSNDISVDVKASSPEALKKADADVVAAMKDIPDTTKVESDLTSTQPQVEVTVDRRKAAEAGLSQAQIAGLVNATVNPLSAGEVTFGFRTLPVQVGEGQELTGLDDLKNLKITTGKGQVPLSDFASVKREEAEAAVTTQNTDRVSTVTITPTTDGLGSVSSEVNERLSGLELPDGATATVGGAATQQSDSFAQLGLAVVAAIAIVYVILVAAFKSLVQPLILLVSVPFAATGALAALLISGIPLGLASLIGLLMLVGIVVTNAIVLIDLINQYRRPGPGREAMSLEDAITHGALRRLRPILMTALATIFAMTPMALGITGSGGFISQPLAVVVIGGLVTSTLLTLLLVPVLYRLVEGRRERRRAAKSSGAVGPEAESDLLVESEARGRHAAGTATAD